jgi:nucleoside-diphosphate-sugar epimerase
VQRLAGHGLMPFIHLDDATSATVLAPEHESPAPYNITDDDPAPTSEWLPALASAPGAKRPFRIPAALGFPAAYEQQAKPPRIIA